MMITANAVTTNPLREPVLTAPQPHTYTGLACETAVVGLAEKMSEAGPAHETVALAEINQTLKTASIGLQFEFAKEAGKMIAKVADVESGNVIRQIPSEEVVRILNALGKLQGLLMNQTILNRWSESRGKLQGLLVSQTI
jgi:flagellar protein FlaG